VIDYALLLADPVFHKIIVVLCIALGVSFLLKILR
jgi:hypothetical protein